MNKIDTAQRLDVSSLKDKRITEIWPLDGMDGCLDVTWSLGRRCNFACSYCDKEYHDATSPHRSFLELLQGWNLLRKAISQRQLPARIYFTGGEPVLNADFAPFVTFLNSNQREYISRMGLTTNGTGSFELYKDILSNVDWICFSTHFEWWNETQFMSVLLDLWRWNKSSGRNKYIYVNLMYENWGDAEVSRILDVLKREGIPQTPYKVFLQENHRPITRNRRSVPFDYRLYLEDRGEAYPVPATSLEAEVIPEEKTDGEMADADFLDVMVRLNDGTTWKTSAVQLVNSGVHNFPKWVCAIQDSLWVDNDGVVWAGNCRFQKLGHLYEGFEPLSAPVTCDGRLCMCVTDVKVHKIRPSSPADL